MAATLAIRDVEPADAVAIRRIYAPYVERDVCTFDHAVPEVAEVEARVRAITVRLPWLVAERAGAVVAYADAGPFRSRPAYAATVETAIYVAPAQRGGGIGDALYARLLARLPELGVHRAMAVITVPNPASERFHERHGFELRGILDEVGRKFERWLDVAVYQRPVEGADEAARSGITAGRSALPPRS